MTRTDFVHCHVHTEYSVLDGLGGIKHYVQRAVEHGQPALAITDHGNVCGWPEFYAECRKAGIEPLLGEEFYLVDDAKYRPAKGEGQPERYHFTVLAKGFEGYKTLAQLSTEAHRNYYYKPVVDRGILEALGDEANNLVVLSGCASSRLSHHLLAEDEDAASEELLWWRETFPDWYVELMHHDTPFDKRLNESLIEMAGKYRIPWVVTNDPHYVVPEDDCYHDTLLAIQTASDIDDPDRFRFDGGGYHLRSRSEMRRAFKTYGDEVWKPGARATLEIAKKCQVRVPQWESRVWQIPKFPDTDDPFRELRRLTYAGLRRLGLEDDDRYVSRAKSELKVYKATGISDFMLITLDAIREAKERGIPVGAGRGSVCGTLVGYLIGVHKIDPVKYDLMFERFLNPARPRMPDIDTDFGQARRKEMFDYCVDKYGAENVMHVCTYGRMKVKKAFQSLSKAYGVSFPDRNRLSAAIVEDRETNDFILPEEITKQYPDLTEQLVRLNGVRVSVGTHPAGVIIAGPEQRVREQVPEMWIASSKKMVGQYDLDAVEHTGLMKQDFLGLRTLDTIDVAVKFIKRFRDEDIDPDSWVPDEEPGDAKVYKMIAEGRTAGVFQMEGPTNQRGCRAVKPKNFEDIVSITSLYRTGAISAGFPAVFIANRKSGRIPYVHPKLKPILERTSGVVLYQEQVMEFGSALAGFDMVQVDDIKEAIKHKKSDLLKSMREPFIEGCIKHSRMKKAQAAECWRMIEGYSGYGYNRSHAVAYTFTTYQTARLKKMYPLEYITALLNTVSDDKDGKEKKDVYMREAIELKFKILPPDINASDALSVPVPDQKAIRLGFTGYAGIGIKQAEKIVLGRPEGGYSTVAEVEAAVRNKGVMRILAEGGALTSLGVAGDRDRTEALLNWSFDDRMAPYRKKYRDAIEQPVVDDEYCCVIGEIFSITKGQTKTGKEYMTWKIRYSVTEAYDIRMWSETSKHWSLGKGSVVMVEGKWEGKWQNISVGRASNIKVLKRARAK
jgi:DNA polymerase-3 subunit alpha